MCATHDAVAWALSVCGTQQVMKEMYSRAAVWVHGDQSSTSGGSRANLRHFC